MPLTEPTDTRALRGLIVRTDADRVIVQATPEEVQRFQPREGQTAQIQRAGTDMPPGGHVSMMGDLEDRTLYDRHGRPVAVVDDVDIHYDRFDVTTFSSREQHYINGPMQVRITAHGIPRATFEPMTRDGLAMVGTFGGYWTTGD